MNFLWYLLLSIISGVLAGMGMGGGTLLLPLLTIIMKVEQQIAQSTNLIVFVPCSIIFSIIYMCQKQIDFKLSYKIIIPAVAVAILGSLLAVNTKSNTLKIIFGAFLILLGLFQLVLFIIKKIKNKKNQALNN